MTSILAIALWLQFLEAPAAYVFEPEILSRETFRLEDCSIEVMYQRNGPATVQQVIEVIPAAAREPLPAVVVPYYFPEAMLGCSVKSIRDGSVRSLSDIGGLEGYKGIEMMAQLARRGFACISAESYHLTYIPQDLERDDFKRWKGAAEAFNADYPQWCGAGKIVADTRLLVDILEADPRIDGKRIGIAGHSLGGKTAFYTGCLDPRIKIIIASDWGYLWDSTNWDAEWYWGDKLRTVRGSGPSAQAGHGSLIDYGVTEGQVKSFCWIAGHDDSAGSLDAFKESEAWRRYFRRHHQNFLFINHATGHRPTAEALDQAYDFLQANL